MVPDLWLMDYFHHPAQLLVACFRNRSVFCDRHDVVGIPDHVNKRNLGLRQRRQLIEWITCVGQRFSFRKPVGL